MSCEGFFYKNQRRVSPSISNRSSEKVFGHGLNLYAGLAMLVFGLGMLWLVRRG